MRYALILGVLFAATTGNAQWEIQPAPTTADLRGIDNVGKGIAWASGSDGTVLHTTDDGAHWQLCPTPPDAEKLDFRGIQAFDEKTAIVMSTGKGPLSRLYKTTDGCRTWHRILKNTDKDGSWVGVIFTDYYDGFLLGEPVHDVFQVRDTNDHGSTWLYSFSEENPNLHAKSTTQRAFAVGISSLWTRGMSPQPLAFSTGGVGGSYLYTRTGSVICESASELLVVTTPCHDEWLRVQVPIGNNNNSSGIYSFAFKDIGLTSDEYSNITVKKNSLNKTPGIAVGGDSLKPEDAAATGAYTFDGGKTWLVPQTPPHGFRSAVAYDEAAKTWITVGPNGTDISTDDGRNWRALRPNPALHEPADADRDWNALSLPFVVGPHGRIGRLRPESLK